MGWGGKIKVKGIGQECPIQTSKSTQALTPKQLGEIAEAEFIAKAVGMGFVVAKPWGIVNLMILS